VKNALAHLVLTLVVLMLAILFALLGWWGLIAVEAAALIFIAIVLFLVGRVRDAGARFDRDVPRILSEEAQHGRR